MLQEPITKYLVLVIVTWRVTHLISTEDGPFELIIKFRKLVGNTFLGQLMDCFYCLSIWIGLGIACLGGNSLIDIIIMTPYYSGLSILLEKVTNKHFT